MKFTSKLSAFAGALVFAGSVFAAEGMICPSIDDIKEEGVSESQELFANFYITYQLSSYNTDTEWTFVLAPIQGDSDEMAIENGNELISTMSSEAVIGEEDGISVCLYDTGSEQIYGVAVPTEYLLSPVKLKKFVKIKRQ
ncbi:MAG: DUF4949 domain-containing protein [Legionella sp.]|nr:DUF4949 domain-containing protein [Legionella sp.]